MPIIKAWQREDIAQFLGENFPIYREATFEDAYREHQDETINDIKKEEG